MPAGENLRAVARHQKLITCSLCWLDLRVVEMLQSTALKDPLLPVEDDAAWNHASPMRGKVHWSWAGQRVLVLGPVILLEMIHFFPILIEHANGGLDNRSCTGHLVAFNALKLMFLVMLDNSSKGGGLQWLYFCLTPVLAVLLTCGALLWGHVNVHDLHGGLLLASVVFWGLLGLALVGFFLYDGGKAVGGVSFVRRHPGWVPMLVVIPLVPCVLVIESGFKGNDILSEGDREEQKAPGWNAHLLLIYMLTAYGSMGMMLRGGAGHWTRALLAVCYVLIVIIAATWLCFHDKVARLTAEASSVLGQPLGSRSYLPPVVERRE